jgi:hypothetical protein
VRGVDIDEGACGVICALDLWDWGSASVGGVLIRFILVDGKLSNVKSVYVRLWIH